MQDVKGLPALRPSPGLPLWLQVKHAVRDHATFSLKAGDRIPTEQEICSAYGISRITVRQAVSSLVYEGLLDRQQGRGTFVLPQRRVEDLSDPEHFLASGFDRLGPEFVSVYSRETVVPPDWIRARLGLRPSENVFKIRKRMVFDGEPAAFRTSFIPVRAAPGLLAMDLDRPLYELILAGRPNEDAEAVETIEYIVADEFRAEILKVRPGHPLMVVDRILYGPNEEALECSRAYHRADRFRFQHRLRRGVPGGGSRSDELVFTGSAGPLGPSSCAGRENTASRAGGRGG